MSQTSPRHAGRLGIIKARSGGWTDLAMCRVELRAWLHWGDASLASGAPITRCGDLGSSRRGGFQFLAHIGVVNLGAKGVREMGKEDGGRRLAEEDEYLTQNREGSAPSFSALRPSGWACIIISFGVRLQSNPPPKDETLHCHKLPSERGIDDRCVQWKRWISWVTSNAGQMSNQLHAGICVLLTGPGRLL